MEDLNPGMEAVASFKKTAVKANPEMEALNPGMGPYRIEPQQDYKTTEILTI